MLPAFSVDTLETAGYVVQLFPRNVYLELVGCAEPGNPGCSVCVCMPVGGEEGDREIPEDETTF